MQTEDLKLLLLDGLNEGLPKMANHLKTMAFWKPLSFAQKAPSESPQLNVTLALNLE